MKTIALTFLLLIPTINLAQTAYPIVATQLLTENQKQESTPWNYSPGVLIVNKNNITVRIKDTSHTFYLVERLPVFSESPWEQIHPFIYTDSDQNDVYVFLMIDQEKIHHNMLLFRWEDLNVTLKISYDNE